MSDVVSYLRCLADQYTPVRDAQGNLLGAVPRAPDNALALGQFPLMISAQVCVMVDVSNGQSPSTIDGFIPFDNKHADLSTPAVSAEDDLTEGV